MATFETGAKRATTMTEMLIFLSATSAKIPSTPKCSNHKRVLGLPTMQFDPFICIIKTYFLANGYSWNWSYKVAANVHNYRMNRKCPETDWKYDSSMAYWRLNFVVFLPKILKSDCIWDFFPCFYPFRTKSTRT